MGINQKKLFQLLLYTTCTFLLNNSAYAERFNSKVFVVLDGDTVLVKQGESIKKVRLANIDAPEKQQKFGPEAKAQLSKLVLNKNISIETTAVDNYGRLIGWLTFNQQNINQEMVRTGYAWEYSYYHHDKTLKQIQIEAQQNKRGLWQDNNPQEPSQWRKQHTPTSDNKSSDLCHKKRYCTQMTSCQEAKQYLQQCDYKHLDSDHDGTPCEALCQEIKH